MEKEIILPKNKILDTCFVERFSSGLIEIIFDSKNHDFSLFRNAVDLITVKSYTTDEEELILIKELKELVSDHRDYRDYYSSSSKKQASIIMVPWKMLDV